MYRGIFILVLTLTFVRADDLTLSDGTIYKNAKIVSHDKTNITILYADGGATLPIAKLPADLQKKFGFDSDSTAISDPATDKTEQKKIEWNNYRKALDKYVALNDKLVLRDAAGVVKLNVKLNHVAEIKSSSGEDLGRGSFVDLYGDDAAASTDPSTFKPIGSPVFLKDYVLNTDKITKIEAVKTGATELAGVYYVVVQPFSFDFWKKAGSPQ